MPKVALCTAAAVFVVLAVVEAILYTFEVNIIINGTLFRPGSMVAGAILFTLLAVWMIIAILDTRRDR